MLHEVTGRQPVCRIAFRQHPYGILIPGDRLAVLEADHFGCHPKVSLKHIFQGKQRVRLPQPRTSGVPGLSGGKLTCPALEKGAADGSATFAFGLALGALTNLIDNAIHWLKVSIPRDSSVQDRRIFLDVISDHEGRPTVVIADNGPGFRDPPQQVVEPFFSRRPDGMGLGLYYANLAMNLNDGKLLFPSMDDFDVPEEFNGAVVALAFKGE